MRSKMNINLILPSFSFLFFFFCCTIRLTLAINATDYTPVNLKNSDIKVKDLRILLEKRGVSYHGFHEKSEFINALSESGPVTVGELKIARNSTTASMLSDAAIEELVYDITFEGDVPENVLKSKDSMWLVRIEPDTESRGTKVLEETVWRRLIEKLASFEVQFGRFECKNAVSYCKSKSWNSPTLILVVPRLHGDAQLTTNAEQHILKPIKNAANQWVYEADSVVQQVYVLLDGKLVHYLPTQVDFDALRTSSFNCSIQFVLLTNLRQCPFMLSALAARFNYGTHCFAYGPKTITGSTLNAPNNQSGAIYIVKSYYFYESTWQIISNSGSAAGVKDDMLSAIVTYENLCRLLSKYLSIKTKKLKLDKKKQPEKVKESEPPPKRSSRRNASPIYGIDFDFCLKFFGGLVVILVGLPIGLYKWRSRYVERRRIEEYNRYRMGMSNRDRSNEQDFWRDFNLEQEEDDDGEFDSITAFSPEMSNQEFPLRTMEQYIRVLTILWQYPSDWYKKVFDRYTFDRMVGRKMRKLLDHYDIDIEEIGFPPYNWILRLPKVEISDLPENVRLSECPICQEPIDNNDSRLCRLPCSCKKTIYHYDCIAPWLIKREDPNSHNFWSSWKFHTERPCPTCRFDVTKWGLQQLVDDE